MERLATIDFWNGILQILNDFYYQYILIGLLLFAGFYFTIKSRFVQIRLLGEGLKVVMEPKEGKEKNASYSFPHLRRVDGFSKRYG